MPVITMKNIPVQETEGVRKSDIPIDETENIGKTDIPTEEILITIPWIEMKIIKDNIIDQKRGVIPINSLMHQNTMDHMALM
ncbi:Pv-fam-d protein [Plasmodium vivax Brazil I]|uniref:Pv-fam-d protein n=2 Tax=Plasmodium vivax TaxID=5855 RepID=A0A0J9WAK3_PLAVI|nr:Pv-fam-d protein [Plasmodium vivax Brazil I]KMZ97753.1 Pv-fam-d protein [Plasmodium vivax North Korean]